MFLVEGRRRKKGYDEKEIRMDLFVDGNHAFDERL